jgi:hypothetical protein
MIVIPPRDPNENNGADPAAEALGKLYEQFTNVQNLAEFHAALRKRDALYEAQHGEMNDGPQDYGNLHPKDFFDQFHRRADEDDKAVVAEAPYRIRQQLRDALAPERDTALDRARETYKKLFIDRQLAQLDQDRPYYLGKIADAVSDQDRERHLTALVGRLKLSGDVGLLYKQDAERLIENIPSDLDTFTFNREFVSDPARAQRLLLYGAYPNIRPELRDELVKAATEAVGPSMANLAKEAVTPETIGGAASAAGDDVNAELKRSFTTEGIEEFSQQQKDEGDSTSNNGEEAASNRGGGAGLVQVAGAPSGTKAPRGQKAQPARQVPSGASSEGDSIPGLPDIPKDLNGVPPNLAAVVFAAAGDQEPALMEAVANTIKNRIGLNVYGLANLNSYDDVIYQWTSGRILRDRNGRPLRDRYGNPRRQGDRPQFNEITGRQMERAYAALTTDKGASALRGPDDELALADAFETAENVYHGRKRDNTIPPTGGRGAVFFHDRSIPTPPDIAKRIVDGDLRELFPAGPNAGIRFYGYTEQGYEKDRIKK